MSQVASVGGGGIGVGVRVGYGPIVGSGVAVELLGTKCWNVAVAVGCAVGVAGNESALIGVVVGGIVGTAATGVLRYQKNKQQVPTLRR